MASEDEMLKQRVLKRIDREEKELQSLNDALIYKKYNDMQYSETIQKIAAIEELLNKDKRWVNMQFPPNILKKVPLYNYSQHAETEERHLFFTENLKSKKYYYMNRGHTLVPLGTFIRFEELGKFSDYSIRYGLMFSIPPYDSGIGVGCGEELSYTDSPPAAGSVPLTYADYKSIRGGEKTRKCKNKKLKKAQKYKNKKLNKTQKYKKRR